MNLRFLSNARPLSPPGGLRSLRFFAATSLVAAAVLVAGCSSSSGPGTPSGDSGAGRGDGGGSGSSSLAGKWTASALALSYTTPSGDKTSITTGQTLVLTQSGDAVTFTFSNTDDTDGTCSGTLSGSTITSMCSLTQLAGDKSCTASFSRTDTVDTSASPMTMTTSYTYTAGGGSACDYSSDLFVLSGTLTFGS